MSMREPGFAFNPQTGECDPPTTPAQGSGHVSQSATGGVDPDGALMQNRRMPWQGQGGYQSGYYNTPQEVMPQGGPPQYPSANPQSQGDRRSRKDRVVSKTYSVVLQTYWLVMTRDSARMLVHKATGQACPLDVKAIASEIQHLALSQGGLSVTRGEVKNALEAMEGDGSYIPDVVVSAGQAVLDQTGTLHVNSASGISVLSTHGQFSTRPVMQPVGFYSLPNAKGPTLHLNQGANNADPLVELLDRLNVPEEARLLVITWLVVSLMPEADRVLLNVIGGRSSGKSTLQTVLKDLIDPSYAPLTQDIPATPAKTYRLGEQDQVISLDNVEELTGKAQRALLELMAGRLTDISASKQAQPARIMLKHPVVLNSAESVLTWPDLADRSVLIRLPDMTSIDPHFYRYLQNDASLHAAFTSLVWLLSYVGPNWSAFDVGTCANGLEHFGRIGKLIAPVMGRSKAEFDQQLEASLAYRFELEQEEMPVVEALRGVLATVAEGEERLDLPVKELLERLNDFRPDNADSQNWPRSPRQLGAKLNDASAVMAAYGIRVGQPVKKGKHGLIHRSVEKCTPTPYREYHASRSVDYSKSII